MDELDKIKLILVEMYEQTHHGFIFSDNLMSQLIHEKKSITDKKEIPHCPTCGSCGKENCCPPNKCKFGVNYINNLRNELSSTRKALGAYIGMKGYNVTEEIINQEVEFYGK
jgi:hypothetical protein